MLSSETKEAVMLSSEQREAAIPPSEQREVAMFPFVQTSSLLVSFTLLILRASAYTCSLLPISGIAALSHRLPRRLFVAGGVIGGLARVDCLARVIDSSRSNLSPLLHRPL